MSGELATSRRREQGVGMRESPGPNPTSACEQKDESKPGAGEEKEKEVGRGSAF